jgi:hypothetical protein
MRPEKAKQLIDNAIQKALLGECSLLYKCDLTVAINKLMEKLKVELSGSWSEYNKYEPTDNDYNSMVNELFYISDRFNVPHRLKWLRFGIENKLFNSKSLALE